LSRAERARRRNESPEAIFKLKTNDNDTPSAVSRESGLNRALTKSQIVMIGLGGAIGTGLFMGSGIAIGYAGPAVLISYAIAAAIVLVMVLSLSEMAVAHPTAGSFGVYAEIYIGKWAGFMVRYTYWFAQIIATGGEAVAVGLYMSFWFPEIPLFLWSVGFSFVLLWINARSVANFGSIEYWFALIKVVAIIVFIIFGLTHILGLGVTPIGLGNLTELPGGFMPNGWSGVWFGLLVALFSFFGVELVAVTAGEAENPAVAIPAALRSLALRLFLFYFLAIGIMVSITPWTQAGATIVTQSPFVKLFEISGVRHVAGIMNFVVITAALSSMNTNLYLASRMLFSLGRGGYAPGFAGKLSSSGTPLTATLISGLALLPIALTSYLTKAAYNYLVGIAVFAGILIWIVILVCHLRFRKVTDPALFTKRIPLFPIPQIAAITLLAALLITMAFDTQFWNISWIFGVPWLILLFVAYLIWRAFNRSRADH
jgi:amino acid transporter, AAT family